MITFVYSRSEVSIITERERIRELRETLCLTREQFGQRVGVSKSVMTNIELDRAGLNPVLLQHICDVFGASRHWIETGEGDMFDDLGPDAAFERLCTEIAASDDEFLKRAMRAYWELSDDRKQAVRDFIDQLAGK